MKISENFDDTEFFKPNTYQELLSAGSLPVWFLNPELIRRMQIIRTHFGKKIHINRAFSTEAENNAIPHSSKWSQHKYGQACDFGIDGISSQQIFNFIKINFKTGAVGMIDTENVHLDVRNSDYLVIIKY